MNFADEIKKVQGSGILQIDNASVYDKKKQLYATNIAEEIKRGLLYLAKSTPKNMFFTYDGYVSCFGNYSEEHGISKFEIFDILDQSLFQQHISLSSFGADLIQPINQFLSKDGIIVKSFCCLNPVEKNDCIELPVLVSLSNAPFKDPILKMKGKNKKIKKIIVRGLSISDYLAFGVHCVYNQ